MISAVMLVRHVFRPDAFTAAEAVEEELRCLGLEVIDENSTDKADLVLAMGGDGTILSAAARARHWDIPLLGVNMGHMGFLAETTGHDLALVARRIASEDFHLEERMTLDVDIRTPDGNVVHDWALNEAVVIHTDLAHPAHLGLAVDGQDVSTYGADGIILATPTGSTAYSFSAGGPVVWPDTEAVVMAPLAAHGLFTRPLVVGPSSVLDVIALEENWAPCDVWCDGLRQTAAPPGTIISTRVGSRPMRLVRLDDTPFSARLVERFSLPVRGWRTTRWREASQ